MLAKCDRAHLAGKLFRQGIEAQHRAATYLGTCFAVTVFSTPDVSLWGLLRTRSPETPVRDLANLKERIYATVSNVTPQMLRNMCLI